MMIVLTMKNLNNDTSTVPKDPILAERVDSIIGMDKMQGICFPIKILLMT